MNTKKLENILNNGSFSSEISPEVELALKAKLDKTPLMKEKKSYPVKLVLDFDEINKEAIKLSKTRVRYPKVLPKGVVISVRKRLSVV